MRAAIETFFDDLPPHSESVIGREPTDYGWRGLTSDGRVLEFRSHNGKAEPPDGESMVVQRDGVPVARMAVSRDPLAIGAYLAHFDRGGALFRENDNLGALREFEAAGSIASTAFVRFNRAMALLALGRWHEGFDEYWRCETAPPFLREPVRAALEAGLRPWRGEGDIAGKRVLLIHAHGFGDTLMTLRYVPVLTSLGADVRLMVPPELKWFAAHFGRVVSEIEDADFFCPMLHLLGALRITPNRVQYGGPYLHVDGNLRAAWAERAGPRREGIRRIGVAWSTGAAIKSDYPRAIALDELVAALGDAELHSVQIQRADEAQALGVRVHEFEDFADCGALMMAMDQIVSIDTAALHLAGAIGHPRVDGLLSHWASWRWLAPWYANVRLHRPADPGASVLAQIVA